MLLFSSHYPNLSALYWILILSSSKVLLNTLSGNSPHKEHQPVVPPATCFPSLTLVHDLVLCQSCTAHIALLALLFSSGIVLFFVGCQTYSGLFHPTENPWHLIPQRWEVIRGRAYLPICNYKKMLCISNKQGLFLTLKPCPWVLMSPPCCRSTSSPRDMQLLNAPIAGPFPWPKGHQSWGATQMQTAAQCSVATQLDCLFVLSLSSTWWK